MPAVTLSAERTATTTATLTIEHWTAAWYYKGSQTNTTCSAAVAAGTDTATITNLNAGAGDTYTAYSDASCTKKLADVTLPAVTLSIERTAATAATLTITHWLTQAWYYKGDQANASCHSVTANITNVSIADTLTAGTAYTYTAYSDANCTTTLASVPLPAVRLSVERTAATTATLTLTGWSQQWRYKGSQTNTTCSAAVPAGTTTADITGLTEGQGDTYTVYSDTTCTTTLLSESVQAVRLSAERTSTTAATLTIHDWTTAWYYKGDQTNTTCSAQRPLPARPTANYHRPDRRDGRHLHGLQRRELYRYQQAGQRARDRRPADRQQHHHHRRDLNHCSPDGPVVVSATGRRCLHLGRDHDSPAHRSDAQYFLHLHGLSRRRLHQRQ